MSFWEATTLYDSYSLYCDVTGRDNKLNSQNFSVKLLKQASGVFGVKHVTKGKDSKGAFIKGVRLRNSPKPCDDPHDGCDDLSDGSVTTSKPYAASIVTTMTAQAQVFTTHKANTASVPIDLSNFLSAEKVEKSRHSRHYPNTARLEVVTQVVTEPSLVTQFAIINDDSYSKHMGKRVTIVSENGLKQVWVMLPDRKKICTEKKYLEYVD